MNAAAALMCLALAALPAAAAGTSSGAPLPQQLRDTGLFAEGAGTAIRAENIPFSPQYPLWSDGTRKRRWLYLPPGTAIDASDPDAWEFPRGTRLWKEFSHAQRVETRYIERLADGSWRFAAYVWNPQQTEALLAPEEGIAAHPARGAPNGRYAVPGRSDCLGCHEGAAVPVLGVSALQLSPDRDPQAAHAEPSGAQDADLRVLVARGLLRNLSPELLARPPRIAAKTPAARAALGYLHGNCGHCHNDVGPLANVELAFAQQAAAPEKSALRTLQTLKLPGRAGERGAVARMKSRNPHLQMPPLGVSVNDAEGIALVERWMHHDLPSPLELSP